MKGIVILFGVIAACGLALSHAKPQAASSEPTPEDAEFFQTKVWPVLKKNCVLCHGGEEIRNGLDVTSRKNLLSGGKHGPAVVPGKPEKSYLIQVIRYQGKIRMPPREKLDAQHIEDLTAWVKMGAPWPKDER